MRRNDRTRPRLRCVAALAVAGAAAVPVWAQGAAGVEGGRSSAAAAEAPALRATASLVLVPVTVRTPAGALVHGLRARDFQVTEDGAVQTARLERAPEDEAARQPLDLVVVLQTGGAAAGALASYAGLRTMLEAIGQQGAGETAAGEAGAGEVGAGGTATSGTATSGTAAGGAAAGKGAGAAAASLEVALETFDSRPEEEWSFTPDVAELEEGWLHPSSADGGAAIYDAVEHGIAMLRTRPAGRRRVLLLVSQEADEGSTARELEVVRDLGEANVAVFSLRFSPEAAWLKEQFTRPRHENPPYRYGADGPLLLHTFDLGTPLLQAVHAMRKDAAAEMAMLSGGASLPFAGRRAFDAAMGQVANSLANQYVLSFQPPPAAAKGDGFHRLGVEVRGQPELRVAARSGYWSGPGGEAQPAGR